MAPGVFADKAMVLANMFGPFPGIAGVFAGITGKPVAAAFGTAALTLGVAL